MTYQNDPDRPRSTGPGFGRNAEGGMSWLPIALAAAVVVALFLMFMPSRDTAGTRTTETTPNATKPVTPTPPPANNPAPTPTPGPAK